MLIWDAAFSMVGRFWGITVVDLTRLVATDKAC
jgi:hypothetical protein